MRLPLCLASLMWLLTWMPAARAQFQLEKEDAGVRVLWNGQLITQYLTARPSPILWPLLGPDNVKLTRDYPMLPDTAGEKRDHPHHRSLWFTHGAVNGSDFWHKGGTVVHQEFTTLESGPQAVIGSVNLWIKNDGEKVLTERRRMTFHADEDMRWIDFDIVLDAEFGEVHFGDTKEGSFAVRVAETMKVDAGKGGRIVNSEGKSNLLAWGQRAAWVNYTGPVGEKTYGVAMFCHPSSFNFPHRWHVRTYGLFAANPFGEQQFVGGSESGSGVVLKDSEALKLRYRVLLHRGISDQQVLQKINDEFANSEPVAL
ncbi:MAG: PmoA family protein [Pirellulaceae bacterium]|nr:PmoA family protein [Pirellulaceae bacterium]